MISRMKLILGTLGLAVVALAASAQFGAQPSGPATDVPAFHPAGPRSALPPILTSAQLDREHLSHGYQKAAYTIAAKIPGVLYQEPCYCRCDRAMGHQSLHSCFEGTHGGECSTCMKEAEYSYRETQRGQTPAL